MTDRHLSDKAFSDLGLEPPLLAGTTAAGFRFCTPIQAATLPVALAGRDVAGQAQTGTGKSAAFLLALFHHLLTRPASPDRKPTQPRALILAPTRELAIQIHKDAEVLGRETGFRLVLVYGGTGYDSQRQALEAGVDVLIGTPGRIIDYFKQHVFDLQAIQVMVLDEADRMFDLGFIKDIRFLLRRMPPPTERLNMLFSATLSWRVTELAYEHMNNAEFVRIEPDKVTADRVTQVVYHTGNDEKIPLLVGLLRHMDPHRSLVFINTKGGAERVSAWLTANGFNARVISGDVPQKTREHLLRDFSTGVLPILIATDVAARGLHIPDVSHVFNFDLPQDAEDYVHRIGRTARAGATGDAISFACEAFAFSLPEIEKYIGHKIAVGQITDELLPKLIVPERRYATGDERRGRHGRPGGGHKDRGGRRDTKAHRGHRGHREHRKEHAADAPQAAAEPAPPPAPAPEARPQEARSTPKPPAHPPAPRRPPHRRGGEKPAIG
jgi:ATP-dependent RNA helicase RhlB